MNRLNSKSILRIFLVFASLFASLLIVFFISLNLIVDPIIYWLASNEVARIIIAFIFSWLVVSKAFDLFYQCYKRRKRMERFNALNVPYPRMFRGRK